MAYWEIPIIIWGRRPRRIHIGINHLLVLHYIFVIAMTVLASVIVYAIGGLGYIDALVLASGACTQTALHSTDLTHLHLSQQIILYIWSLISGIPVDMGVIFARLYMFERRFQTIVRDARAFRTPRRERPQIAVNENFPVINVYQQDGVIEEEDRAAFDLMVAKAMELQLLSGNSPETKETPGTSNADNTIEQGNCTPHSSHQTSTNSSVELSRQNSNRTPRRDTRPTFREQGSSLGYMSWNPTLGRKSNRVDLTSEQKDELGGIEYRSLKTLFMVEVILYISLHAIAVVGLVPWMSLVDSGLPSGTSKPWVGAFIAASAVNNWGFAPTKDSLVFLQTSIWPFLFISFLMLAGGMGYPCILQFVLWTASKFLRYGSARWESVRFCLDHPRMVSIQLFTIGATRMILLFVFLFCGLNLMFFMTLNLHNTSLTNINMGNRVMAGILQGISTKTAGFTTTDLSESSPAMQAVYLAGMYLRLLPLMQPVSINTKVYEAGSLGIYSGQSIIDHIIERSSSLRYYVQRCWFALSRDIGRHIWAIGLAVLIIAIVENPQIATTTNTESSSSFSLFAIIFEVVSAYCNVGFSLGSSSKTSASLCAQFHTFSKLVITAAELIGSSRGLPTSLKQAILLPSESQQMDADSMRLPSRGSV